jgi:hypothetical protein
MLTRKRPQMRRAIPTAAILLFLAMQVMLPARPAAALITGGEGNATLHDPGWPSGAAAIFNAEARAAWWAGPPFGGGEWHAECRGDAKAFNAVLADFAKLDVKNKRLVVHDGIAQSLWINPNRAPAKRDAAKIDWTFTVWQAGTWQRMHAKQARDAAKGPPSQIDVYTGGNIRWADVVVPKDVTVVDERLEAHGFTAADGIVLEGKAVDLATGKPIAARMQLQRNEPQPNGGYRRKVVAEAATDKLGHWVLKNAPAGSAQVVILANGYVPRVAGYTQGDDRPHWQSFDCKLSRPGPISGKVVDADGKPLAGVRVNLMDVLTAGDGIYSSPDEYSASTNGEGRFQLDQVPLGSASVWVYKSGYCRPGLGLKVTTPAKDVALTMIESARVRVVVAFPDGIRPEGYIVEMQPEGGSKVGTWSGSGNIDKKNEITFTDIPPGRYVLHGHPNPSNGKQESQSVTVELQGGQAAGAVLTAK